jgi:hypothetical protein
MEHLSSHTLPSKDEKLDSVDSVIAAKYTGVDRDQLRFIRKHCSHCNAGAGDTFEITSDFSAIVRSLLMASRILDPESHPPIRLGDAVPGRKRTRAIGVNVDVVGLRSTARHSTVFWIGCEDKMVSPVSTQTLRHSHTAALNSAHVPSCFSLVHAAELLSAVGPNFIGIDGEQVTAHQSIVTASILNDSIKDQVRYQTASWLQRQLVKDPSALGQRTILSLAWRKYNPDHSTILLDIYDRVERYDTSMLRVFPSKTELEHAHGKLDDIRALDQIAQCTPTNWSYRPITCDCTSTCRIGKAGVLKRTYSCGSEHVILHPTSSDITRHLRCLANQRRTSRRKAAQDTERWFHQEFVQDLRRIGEFRVFIVTVSDALATRGRKGVVVEVVHTLELEDKDLIVTVLPSSSAWSGGYTTYNKVDLHELKGFALHVFHALRDRPDWDTNFESLEIGARMDIGISMTGGVCRYFVNEITRLYEADFFAEWLSQPGTHICRAVAMAFEEVFLLKSAG